MAFFTKKTNSSSSTSSSKGSPKRFTLKFKRSSTSSTSTVDIDSSSPHHHTAHHNHEEPFLNQIAPGRFTNSTLKRGVSPRGSQYQNSSDIHNDSKDKEDTSAHKHKPKWMKSIRTIIRPKSRHTSTTANNNNNAPTPTKKARKQSTKQTLIELQLRHAELEDTLKGTEEQYHKAEVQNEEYQITIKALRDEVSEAKEDNVQVAGKLEEKDGQLLELKKKHHRAIAVLSAAKVEIEKGHASAKAKGSRIGELEGRLETQEKTSASVSALNRQMEESFARQKKELEDEKEKIAWEFRHYKDEQRDVVLALENERDAVRREKDVLVSKHQKEMRRDRKELSRQYMREMEARDAAADQRYRALEEQTNALIATQAKELEAKNERLRKLKGTIGRIEEKHQRQLVQKNLVIRGLQNRHQEVEWKERCHGLMEAVEELEGILAEKDELIHQLKGPQNDDGRKQDAAGGLRIEIDKGDEAINDLRNWMADEENRPRDKELLHSVRSNLAKIADLFSQPDDANESDAEIDDPGSEVNEPGDEDNEDGDNTIEDHGFDDIEHSFEADEGEHQGEYECEVSKPGFDSEESDQELHEKVAAAAVQAAMVLMEM